MERLRLSKKHIIEIPKGARQAYGIENIKPIIAYATKRANKMRKYLKDGKLSRREQAMITLFAFNALKDGRRVDWGMVRKESTELSEAEWMELLEVVKKHHKGEMPANIDMATDILTDFLDLAMSITRYVRSCQPKKIAA